MAQLYPSFKENLVEEFGPYAAVLGQTEGEPDQIAQIFGLWAAKEFDDAALFGKLRNSVDKFGMLGPEKESGGLAYDDPNSVLINGVIVGSKLHLGWEEILNHDWGHYAQPAQIPDTSDLSWTDILPTRTYAMGDGLELPVTNENRACPDCYWGDFKSIRMKVEQNSENCPAGQKEGSPCGLPSP